MKDIFRYHLFILILLIPEFLFSQTDYEFWFAAPEVTYEVTGPPSVICDSLDRPIVLAITTYDGPAHIVISQPANPAFTPLHCTILTAQFFQIDLTPYISLLECNPPNFILNNGILIESDRPVNAIYEVQTAVNSETFSLKGRNALGTEFIIPSQNMCYNFPNTNLQARQSFSIVATEDMTIVKIIPKKPLEGLPVTDTIEIQLNSGQTWTGRALSGDTSAHLGGSFILANKPIAVTVADDALRPFNYAVPGLSIDLAGDQLIPKERCGNEYIVSFRNENPTQFRCLVYIYAFENGTSVSKDGAFLCTLNKGQVYSYEAPGYWVTGYNDYITSNKKILIYLFSNFNVWNSSSVSGQVFPPITCGGSKKITIALTGPVLYNTANYMYIIVTRNGNQMNFYCSDPVIQGGMNQPATWAPVSGTNNEYVYFITGGMSTPWGTITFSNSTGNFQLSTITHLASTLRTCVHSDFSALNLGPDKTLCSNDTILLDAGYGRNSYLWNTGATTQTIEVTAPGSYSVTVTSGDCTLQDTINIIAPDNTPIPLPVQVTLCPGDSALLDAGPGRTSYLWSTGATTQTIYTSTAGIYWVRVPVFNCDNYITETVMVFAPDSVNLGPDQTICNGDSLLLDAGPGRDSYLWNNGATTQTIWAKTTGTYDVTAVYKNCVFSDSIHLLFSGDSLDVSIIPSDNNICTGASVTFTATPIATGTLTYDWKVNGISQGVNNLIFNYSPANGDVVTCVLSSSITTCVSNNPATSNAVTMVVNPLQAATVAVTPSANNICQGASVIFTANTTPAGGTKHYQWKVNNISSGTDNPVFTYVPANGDNVTCDLAISGLSCITASLVTSQPVNMVVNPNVNLSVSVTASANPVCSGIPVTFTATPPPGGTATYQWKVNGISSGLNQNIFSYVPVNNDVVECGLSIAGMSCLQNNPATSNTITMGITAAPLVTFPACFDTITTTNAKPIHLKGAIPYGGTYSGPGVNSATGIFTPSLAGTGSKAITYTYTNAGLCSSFKVKNIIVQPPAVFSCGNIFTDIRDNHSYKTIQIGTQCWMAKDLDYGTSIIQSQHQRDNCIAEKYPISVPPPFGGGQEGAYQWDEVMDYSSTPGEKGLCPPSWHIPTEAEWQTLFSNWTNSAFAASPLKYSGYSGFTALLTGTIPLNTFLHFFGFTTFYWTSTPHGTYKAWAHGFNEPDPSVSTYPASKENAFSIRCIKD